MKRQLLRIAPIGALIFIIAFWYLAIFLFKIESWKFPAFHEVILAGWNKAPQLLESASYTSLTAFFGFITAAVFGFMIALLFSIAPWVKRSLYPWVLFIQMTPIVASAPILVLWFDSPIMSVAAITFLMGFFPVTANTTLGLLSTDQNLLNLFKINGATKIQELLYLRIPNALPYFLNGLKIAASLALIGAIAGEFFAGSPSADTQGLGYRIIAYHRRSDVPELIATALVACVLGFLFVGSVHLLNWFLLKKWHPSIQQKEP